MPAYMVAEIEVLDDSMYQAYRERAGDLVRSYGGWYVVRGGGLIEPMFGEWQPQRLLVIGFPSREALRACFESPDYRTISPLRERSTVSRSVIVDGWDEPGRLG